MLIKAFLGRSLLLHRILRQVRTRTAAANVHARPLMSRQEGVQDGLALVRRCSQRLLPEEALHPSRFTPPPQPRVDRGKPPLGPRRWRPPLSPSIWSVLRSPRRAGRSLPDMFPPAEEHGIPSKVFGRTVGCDVQRKTTDAGSSPAQLR